MDGINAATRLAASPISAPLSSVSGGTVSPCTLMVKYRSLIDRETNPSAPRPKMMPTARPSTVPIKPSSAASPRISPEICARVAPSARSTPIIGRRWMTLNVTVL